MSETSDRRHIRRRAFATGVLSGVGALYRFDFAFMLPLSVVSGLFLRRQGSAPRAELARTMVAYFTGFLVPLGLWCTVLSLRAGSLQSIVDWASYFLVSSHAKLLYYSLPFPRPRLSDARETGAFLLYLVVISTYVAGIFVGRSLLRSAVPARIAHAPLLLIGSVTGFAIFAQASHRSDLGHLLQVTPPALLVGLALVMRPWPEVSPRASGLAALMRRVALSVYLLCAATAIVMVWPALGQDFSGGTGGLVIRYRGLRFAEGALPDHPFLSLARQVHAITRPGERILVIPNVCNLYFFIERPLSGFKIHFLYRETDAWVARERAAIEHDPPAVVLVDRAFVEAGATTEFDQQQPEIASYIRGRYTAVTETGTGWVILRPDDRTSAVYPPL